MRLTAPRLAAPPDLREERMCGMGDKSPKKDTKKPKKAKVSNAPNSSPAKPA
jgi:hypothetical protein